MPTLEAARFDGLNPYENQRLVHLTDWDPAARRMLVTTRFGESFQLHEVAQPMGARTQLTFYNERVFGGLYRPGHRDEVTFSLDRGGAENYQVMLLDRKTGATRRLSDGTHRYQGTMWSPDGGLLAYVSNARNGRDFDLYVQDPDRPGSERRVAELQGSWAPLDWSPDGTRILLGHYISINESSLAAVDVASGRLAAVSPEPPAGEKVAWRGGVWAHDGSIYTGTDQGSEFLRLVRLTPSEDGGAWTPVVLSGDIPWDVESFDVTDDGRVIAFFTNEDGASRLHLLDGASQQALPTPDLPPGVVGEVAFRPGSHELGFTLSWAHSPTDAYSYDPGGGALVRWTESEVGGLDPARFVVPDLVHYPTFDRDAGHTRRIPAFVYHPEPARFPGPRPVLVNIHGGPEAQARPGFQREQQLLLDDWAWRASTPTCAARTATARATSRWTTACGARTRCKDIGALLDWIATQPDLDAGRG